MSQQINCYVIHINCIMFHKCFQYNLKDDHLFFRCDFRVSYCSLILPKLRVENVDKNNRQYKLQRFAKTKIFLTAKVNIIKILMAIID